MKKTVLKMFAFAALLTLNSQVSEAQNQNNLGADCGCPAVNTRPTIDLSTLATGGVLNATNTVLTCNNNYLLKEKIYVPDGKSITISPGTVILGRDLNAPGAGVASALIVERGGQIIAAGSPTCQIVFTAEEDITSDNILGNYTNVSGAPNGGKWGGVAICGRATNNLLAGPGTPNNESGIQVGTAGSQPSGTGAIEGISNAEADARTWFGGTDDNDNSGIMRYVSIRHAGDIIVAGNELNSLTLASVGRGTTIDHIEISSYADDAIEIFGGTVNLKYCSMIWGDDDGLDWDLGWKGSAQFLFVLNRSNSGNTITDNGIEADGDDNRTNTAFRSHPKIYNCTFIGSNQTAVSADNSGDAGMNFKERTEGEVFNCIVANYTSGVVIDQVNSSRTGGPNNEAHANWFTGFPTSGSLLIGCNTFVNCTTPLNIEQNAVYTYNTLPADNAKFTADGNVSVASLPNFDFAYTMNFAANTVTGGDKYDAVPDAQSTTCTPPADGFFTPAPYRGAFEAGKKSWLSDWTILNLINATNGIVPCPTDVNADGVTNNADFLQLLGEFGQSCD
jgi:hypothetical protein